MKKLIISSLLCVAWTCMADESVYTLPTTEPVNTERVEIEEDQNNNVASLSTNSSPDKVSKKDKSLVNSSIAIDKAMRASGVEIHSANRPFKPNELIAHNQEPEIKVELGKKPTFNVAEYTGKSATIEAAEIITRRDDSLDYLRKKYKSTQRLILDAGKTEAIPIATSATNRIWTNFNKVAFTTSTPTDAALIYAEKGFVYVTPAYNGQPIDLIIEEEGAPETAISLYLTPLNVPPVLVELKVKLNKKERNAQLLAIHQRNEQSRIELEAEKQKERERLHNEQQAKEQDDHVSTVMNLLETVALAEIPSGYELVEGINVPPEKRYPCSMPMMLPLYHEVKQQLIGAKLVVDIMQVRNDVNGLRAFRDEACMGVGKEDVIAVGVLDRATLAPGETSEVYILRDKTYFERVNKKPRRQRVGG